MKRLGRLPLFLWRAASLAVFLAWEIVLSSLRVAWDVLTPTLHATPAIVAMPLDARTDLEITMVAHALSLTPGTLTLDVSDDRRTLLVHVMFAGGDPERAIEHLQRSVERRVLRLLRTWEAGR